MQNAKNFPMAYSELEAQKIPTSASIKFHFCKNTALKKNLTWHGCCILYTRMFKDAVGLQSYLVCVCRVCYSSLLRLFGFSAKVLCSTVKTHYAAVTVQIFHWNSCQKTPLWSQRKPEKGKGFQEEKLIKFTNIIS